MRLGGPVRSVSGPDEWVRRLLELGYSACFCPVSFDDSPDVKAQYRDASAEAGVVIAEVGAWSNPISPDPGTRRAAFMKCCRQLELADFMGARCCVNIAGSRSSRWDGPHQDNLTQTTFEMIVDTVRAIVDAVEPTDSHYTLETMPWTYPDSPDSYLRLLEAVDRDRFAVHLDPVNLISSPGAYFRNSELLTECFQKLGGRIRSCHAKDTHLADDLTVHLSEVRPGAGSLDYRTYVKELERIDADTPLMLEHLGSDEEYRLAAEHIREVAKSVGATIR